ncbi:NYN domain-containing protein [Patescibacteria group bacterium]|nr:MAG: NYN domain-containing protein [Patescibacteria group bacterium]
MIRRKDQRIAVFIDAANMYHSAKNIFNARLNFKNLLDEAVADRQLIRAIAYVITTKGGEEKPFLDALANIGIEIKSKELQEFVSGIKKGDWDVGLAMDAVRIGMGVDAVVLASGDGDFVDLVDYLRHHGKQVEVMAFRESVSSKLVERADGFIDLSADADRFLIRAGRPRGGKSVIVRRGGKTEEI